MTKECGTKQNTARQLLQARYNQSRGTSLKDNTQTNYAAILRTLQRGLSVYERILIFMKIYINIYGNWNVKNAV